MSGGLVLIGGRLDTVLRDDGGARLVLRHGGLPLALDLSADEIACLREALVAAARRAGEAAT